MTIDSIGNTLPTGPSAEDRQLFGAQVVTKTLDYMNNQGGSGNSLAPVDKASFGAAVVAKTLDYMNSGNSHDNGMAQSYDFQKSVLGGHAEALTAKAMGQGGLTDIEI